MPGQPPEISFRPLTRGDFPRLAEWLSQPHVREWWNRERRTIDEVAEKYGPCVDGTDPTKLFAVLLRGEPIGMIETYRLADEEDWQRALGDEFGGAGIDYLIGEPAHCGRGIGSAMLADFVDVVFATYPDIGEIVSAPQRANRASCRALEKAGFVLVEERLLESDDPSDSGVSAIYRFRRPDSGR